MRGRPRRRAGDDPPSPPTISVRTAALALLGRRDYPAAALRERLLTRGYPAADVEAVIAEFTADGTINETRMADAFVRSATRVKGRGRRRIEMEMRARGYGREAIDRALASLPESDEAEALSRLLARKRLPAVLTPAERQRLFQQLQRRGFAVPLISRALGRRRTDADDATDQDPDSD